MSTDATRLPTGPLSDEVARRTWPLTPTCDQIATVLGISPRRWGCILERGGVTVWEADELATRLGLHPACLFGEAWCDAIDAECGCTETEVAA